MGATSACRSICLGSLSSNWWWPVCRTWSMPCFSRQRRVHCCVTPVRRNGSCLPACLSPETQYFGLPFRASYRMCIIERCRARYWPLCFRGYITFHDFVFDSHKRRIDLDCNAKDGEVCSIKDSKGATAMKSPLSPLFGAGPVDYAQPPHGIACPAESARTYYCTKVPIIPP